MITVVFLRQLTTTGLPTDIHAPNDEPIAKIGH